MLLSWLEIKLVWSPKKIYGVFQNDKKMDLLYNIQQLHLGVHVQDMFRLIMHIKFSKIVPGEMVQWVKSLQV